MSCKATTYCNTISAFIDCTPKIYQGEDYYLEIQFFGEDEMPLDLSEFDGIFMCLYTDGFNYGTYQWPEAEGSGLITIIQDENTGGIVDEGIISISIPASQTKKFLTGPMYSEIKFKKNSEVTGEDPIYKTIGCLKIGEVKKSLTRNISDF